MKARSPLLATLSLLLILPLFIGGSDASFQEQDSATIKGQVLNAENGKPVPFANVLLLKEKGDTNLEGTSADAEGRYAFKGLSPGTYRITASATGFTKKTAEGIELDRGEKQELDIELSSSVMKDKVELKKISAPSFESSAARAVEDKTRTEKGASPKKTVKAGQLTAGEINDLGEWEPWKAIREADSNGHGSVWGIEGKARYSVILQNEKGFPLIDAKVELISKGGKPIWKSRTDNTGKAELWAHPFSEKPRKADRIRISYQGKSKMVDRIQPFEEGLNLIQMPGKCRDHEAIEVMLTVDATSSMGDEIEYLKAELKDIVGRIEQKRSEQKIRVGTVFYQTLSDDDYVTERSPLSNDLQRTLDFIDAHPANGGGTESVEKALDASVENFAKSGVEGASARIMLLVLDEPPGTDDSIITEYQGMLQKAASKGIRIIPVVASGTNFGKDKSLEHLMRSTAVISNGRYVFLTDHSGIGGSHTKPTTDSYDVTYLNDLLVDLIADYSYVPSCDGEDPKELEDTVEVEREIIDRVVLDSNASDSTAPPDTNRVVIGQKDSAKTVDSSDGSERDTTVRDSTQKGGTETEIAFKLYPNPTRGPLTLHVETEKEIERFFLRNINGSSLRRIPWEEDRDKKRIDLSGLPNGTYLLVATVGDEKLTGRVVLQR